MKHNIVNKADYRGFFKKKLKYPVTKEAAEYLANLQQKNRLVCTKNENENWCKAILKKEIKGRWTRQALWGYRMFDFWNSTIGCAVEVDGPEHRAEYDFYRDLYVYLRSGVVVVRIRNKNEQDAKDAISFIKKLDPWKERRDRLGISQFRSFDLENENHPYWNI